MFFIAVELTAMKKTNPPVLVTFTVKIMDINKLTSKIIGAAIEVHKSLGPGLLESAYEKCLCHELSIQNFSFENQKPLPIQYKGKELDCGYRLDLVVENAVILELKSCDKI